MAKTKPDASLLPAFEGAGYETLVKQISVVFEQGRQRAAAAVNSSMLETYWQIGHDIVEFEQGGKVKAQYGTHLLENLSKDLVLLHGKGFSLSNLKRMRQFYAQYPNSATLSHQLSWSHYVELLKIFVSKYQLFLPNEDELRGVIEKQLQGWRV